MLVLSRKLNERIDITVNGVAIEITLVAIRGDKVRVGVQAPPEVIIHRHEVSLRIANEANAKEDASEVAA